MEGGFDAPARFPRAELLAAMNDEIIPVVKRLISVCHDGEQFFRQTANLTTNPRLKALLEEYADQRRAFFSELQNEAVAFGETDRIESGSIAGAIRCGWSKLSSMVSAPDDEAILSECESAEDSADQAYKAAVEHAGLPEDLRDVIARQYAEVTSALQNLRELRHSVVPLQ